MIDVTEWAREILGKSQQAAARFNPDVKIRLGRNLGGSVQAMLTDSPEPQDQRVDLGEMTLYVQHDLEGLVDIEEPHDRVVLRPLGSPPNVRGEH